LAGPPVETGEFLRGLFGSRVDFGLVVVPGERVLDCLGQPGRDPSLLTSFEKLFGRDLEDLNPGEFLRPVLLLPLFEDVLSIFVIPLGRFLGEPEVEESTISWKPPE
jgi:hypothetical protein